MANDSEHNPPPAPLAPGHRVYVFEGRDSRVNAFRRLLMQVYSDIRIREPAKMTVVLLSSVVDGFDRSAQFKAMLASVTDPNLVVLGSNRPSALGEDVLSPLATGREPFSPEASDGDVGLTVRGIEAESQWIMRLCEDVMSPSFIGSGDGHEPILGSRVEQEEKSLQEAETLLRAILSASEPRRKAATNDNLKPAGAVLQGSKRRRTLRRLGIAAVPVACAGFLIGHLSDQLKPQASRIRPAADRYEVAELVNVPRPVSAPRPAIARATPPKAGAQTQPEPQPPSKIITEDRHAPIKANEPDSVGDHSRTELALSLPPDATVAVHLTGKALEDALAKDRIATRRLNDAQLARAAPDPQ